MVGDFIANILLPRALTNARLLRIYLTDQVAGSIVMNFTAIQLLFPIVALPGMYLWKAVAGLIVTISFTQS
jgi:hypothetical protein